MIHNGILLKVQAELQKALITDVDQTDPARAGVVKLGPLQGDPDPDTARISVELYENDPDQEIKNSGISANSMDTWADVVEETECGGGITWRRRFTVKARCLLENSRENLTTAREIASTLRSRIERTLMKISFADVQDDGEYVSRGVLSEAIRGEMVQSGGPPDAYDYHIKVRFEVLTSEIVR